MLKMEDHLS